MSAKFGLLGELISYSMSPVIHGIILESGNLDGTYELIELSKEAFSSEAGRLRLKAFDGFNVTTPYKEEIMKILDEIDPFAEVIGAVNTVVNRDGRWIGYNTDYYGFMATVDGIKRKMGDIHSALVMGTGGAARVAVKGLIDTGVKQVTIVSRSPMAAKEKFGNLSCISYNEATMAVDLVVNATPYGQKSTSVISGLDTDFLKRAKFLYDLNYSPPRTILMEMASEVGIESVGGLEMLAIQAIKAEEIWWGKSFVEDALMNRIIEAIKSR